MKTVKKSAYNIVFSLLGQGVTMLIGILIPRLFILSYGSEVNGFLSSVNQIFTYLVLLELGVGAATTQALYGPIGKNDREKISGILSATNLFYKRTSIYYFISVVFLAIVYPLVVKSALSTPLQIAIISIVGMSGVVSYYFQAKYKLLLQAEGKQYILSNVNTIVHVLTSVSKLILIAAGFSVIWLQVAQLILTLAQSVYYSSYIKKKYPWLNLKVPPDSKAIEKKNSAVFHEISWMVFNHTDVLLLTILLQDLKIVSVYVLYNTFIEMVATLIQNVNSGFTFRLGQIYNSDRKRHNAVFDCYETFYMAFSFAIYTVTYMHLMPFMQVYTAGITDVNYLLPLLPVLFIGYKTLVSARNSCGSLITYAGKFRETQWHALIEAIINLAVSIVCIILFEKLWGLGLYGALAGTLAALLFRANVMIVFANKHILERSAGRTYIKWGINLGLMLLLSFAYKLLHFSTKSYGTIILSAFSAVIVVLGVYLLINCLIFRDSTKTVVGYARRALMKKNTQEEDYEG